MKLKQNMLKRKQPPNAVAARKYLPNDKKGSKKQFAHTPTPTNRPTDQPTVWNSHLHRWNNWLLSEQLVQTTSMFPTRRRNNAKNWTDENGYRTICSDLLCSTRNGYCRKIQMGLEGVCDRKSRNSNFIMSHSHSPITIRDCEKVSITRNDVLCFPSQTIETS